MDALGAYVTATTERVDEQRAAERAAQDAEDERSREEIRVFRETHPGVKERLIREKRATPATTKNAKHAASTES